MGGDPGGIRTHDPQIRNLMLYPAELRDHGRFDSKCGQGAEAFMRDVAGLLSIIGRRRMARCGQIKRTIYLRSVSMLPIIGSPTNEQKRVSRRAAWPSIENSSVCLKD